MERPYTDNATILTNQNLKDGFKNESQSSSQQRESRTINQFTQEDASLSGNKLNSKETQSKTNMDINKNQPQINERSTFMPERKTNMRSKNTEQNIRIQKNNLHDSRMEDAYSQITQPQVSSTNTLPQQNQPYQQESNMQRDLSLGQSQRQEVLLTVPQDQRSRIFSDSLSTSNKSSSRLTSNGSCLADEDDSSSSETTPEECSLHEEECGEDDDKSSNQGDDDNLHEKMRWYRIITEQYNSGNSSNENILIQNTEMDCYDDIPNCQNDNIIEEECTEKPFYNKSDCINSSTASDSEHNQNNKDSSEEKILGKRKIRDHCIYNQNNITSKKQDNNDIIIEEKINFCFPQFGDFKFESQAQNKRNDKIKSKLQCKPFFSPQLQTTTTIETETTTNNIKQKYISKSPNVCQKQNTDKTNNQINVFNKAKLLAQIFDGESLSTTYSICKGKNALKFRCNNQHTFFVGVNLIDTISESLLVQSENMKTSVQKAAISNDCWCYKCSKFYESCKEVAAQVGLQVVGGLFSQKIQLKCEKMNHSFDISYSKKLQSLSCSDCRREEREQLKQQLKEEEIRINQENLQKQKELFEQARIQMENQRRQGGNWQGNSYCGSSSPSYSSSNSSNSNSNNNMMAYYQTMETKINSKSKQQTFDYLKNNTQGGQNNQEQVFLVYKFINTPIDFIIAGMQSMMREQALQYFRRLAKQLHPDKNQHPFAKEAFQKLLEANQLVGSGSSPAVSSWKAAC